MSFLSLLVQWLLSWPAPRPPRKPDLRAVDLAACDNPGCETCARRKVAS